MRVWLAAALLLALHVPATGQGLSPPGGWVYPHKIRWPRASIEVPPEVHAFIVSECTRYQGFSEETVPDCISAEKYGYRAVIELLTDPEIGDRAAVRYRICAAGLRDLGGWFHRRKADCIGLAFRFIWRFAFSRETSAAPGVQVAGGFGLDGARQAPRAPLAATAAPRR